MAQAPAITSAVANSPGWVTVGWAHSGQDGALGYRVQRRNPEYNWDYVTHVGLHTDMGLSASTAYEYRVGALYDSADAEWSDYVTVVTQPPEQPRPRYDRPAPVISAHEVGSDYIVIRWSGRTYDRIHLFWREDVPGATGWRELNFDHSNAVGYRRFDGLRPNRRYLFQIQACDAVLFGHRCGPRSQPPFPITTGSPAPPPPPPPVAPIYAVTNDGTLLWFRHEGQRDGSFRWSAAEGKHVGHGWGGFSTVFSGGDGVIYAITEGGRDPTTGQRTGGDLLWYRHDGAVDGSLRWASSGGKTVGHGWDSFTHVFSGGGGLIYALKGNGELMWYRHEGRHDGSFRWTHNNGRSVGGGWQMKQTLVATNRIFAGPRISAGTRIYALVDSGDLLWFQHEGDHDGTDRWLGEGSRKVGHEWRMKDVFAVGDGGVIYARGQNDDLLWFRHDGQLKGTFEWSSNSPSKVGHGWGFKHVFGG